MIRFVVIATIRRGAVDREPLDETGQALAYWRWAQDWSRAEMVTLESELRLGAGGREGFEMSMRDCQVEWLGGKFDRRMPGMNRMPRRTIRAITMEEAAERARG